MEMKKTSRLIGRILAVVMAICIMSAMAITASAATINEDVTKAKDGVVQVQVWFHDPETAIELSLYYGTGFLVNDTTVVTCRHVVTAFPDSFYVNWAQQTKRTAEQVRNCLEIRVMLYRGTYVKASITNANDELDLAILTLDSTIARTPLTLRNSTTLEQTEDVFAIGFPSDLLELDDKMTYDIDDIAITTGNANKVGDMQFFAYDGFQDSYTYYDKVNCIESSARISGGNSGGPLVDKAGNVVGVNAVGSDTSFIAISSKELITYLNALNVQFKEAGKIDSVSSNTESETDDKVDTAKLSSLIAEAKAKTADGYTAESYAALKSAIVAAESALTATEQKDIDAAVASLNSAINGLVAKESGSMSPVILIVIIAAVVVIILVVVIIIVVSASKKKKKAAPAPAPAPIPTGRPVPPAPAPIPTGRPVPPAPAPVARPVPPAPAPVVPSAGETTVLSQGAGETTVLSQGAGETTVLSQAVNGGSLIRLANNERIAISSAEFTVGRERRSVDYCVGTNTNISRVHARFVVRNGSTFIVDNKAANGTFVNGVKARAGQEIELKDGDQILLADEKFEFKK